MIDIGDAVGTHLRTFHRHIFCHIAIERFRQEDDVRISEDVTIQKVIETAMLALGHPLVVKMIDNLASKGLHQEGNNSILVEAGAFRRERHVHQIGPKKHELAQHLPFDPDKTKPFREG